MFLNLFHQVVCTSKWTQPAKVTQRSIKKQETVGTYFVEGTALGQEMFNEFRKIISIAVVNLVHWSKCRPDFCGAYAPPVHQRPSSNSSNAPHELCSFSLNFLNVPRFEPPVAYLDPVMLLLVVLVVLSLYD
jgi:hypothetical protein